MKKTVVFDFDGVIHSYTSGWRGEDVIPDQPVEGIAEEINRIREAGYEVAVVSTRCASPKGMEAVNKYLADNEIVVDKVCKEKPPAIVYIDDRAICFDGRSDELLEKIKSFKPWYQKNNQAATNFESKTSEKERLVELLKEADGKAIDHGPVEDVETDGYNIYADYLLENGVIVPPCKVGDTVWAIALTGKLYKYTVNGFHQFEDKHFMFGAYRIREDGKKVNPTWQDYEIGKIVFIGDNAKEEAEKALKEREANG